MGTGIEGAGVLFRPLSEEAVAPFREGIALTLSKWSALQMAVENEWGGRGSRSISEQLNSDILSWFTQSRDPLYIDDLENILDEAMLSLNTMIEDGSVEEVAEKLMIMHEECLEGNYTSIEKLRHAIPQRVNHQHIRQVANDEDDEDDDEDDRMEDDDGPNMMVDSAGSQSSSRVETPVNGVKSKETTQAEDGWEVVSSRRNRGKRN
ncbi:pre-rRNA-processing protein TSR2 homolog isoform X2 [Tripterygium wilfordii]|uniref:pre-rRNA-processing protein TSR2 homolog isoform X2 n=1 Tax=Tripterygium wilfordii TaxID=458696 RepID=UPI0018F80DBB|nr:pre-rRNA-processing protein TSR2 homolog isoform X2 [Tripterygium wilfordii]